MPSLLLVPVLFENLFCQATSIQTEVLMQSPTAEPGMQSPTEAGENWAGTPNPHESSMNPKFLYSNGHSRGINRISLNLPIKLLCLKILIGCWNYFEGQDGSSCCFFFNGDP